MMTWFFLLVAIGLTIIIAIPFYRVLKGPTVFDRLLGVGAIGTKTTVIICFIGLLYGRLDMFIDIALVYAILMFISVIMISKYFETDKAKE
jgi:multicomponent Na+:H+ antiporter subunit F